MGFKQFDDLGERPVEDIGVEFVEGLGDIVFKHGDVERVFDGLGVILGKLDDGSRGGCPSEGLPRVLIGFADL